MLTITDSNFNEEILNSNTLTIVDFWAPWCGPCKIMAPVLEDLEKEYKGKPVKIGKLNVDENQKTAAAYNILSIPTILFFKDGKVLEQIIGFNPKEVLKAKSDKYL